MRLYEPWPSWRERALSLRLFQAAQDLARSNYGTQVLAIWSFSEAICWFILPDFLLLPLAVLAPDKTRRLIVTAWISSVLGTLVLWLMMSQLPAHQASLIFALPFTHEGMLPKIQTLADLYGDGSAMFQPFSGIPAKVWVYSAVYLNHWNSLGFMGMLALARGLRMAAVGCLGRTIARRAPGLVQRSWLGWLIVYPVLFLLMLTATSR
jgi:membrane protein YqaA with SNARE-associated domain